MATSPRPLRPKRPSRTTPTIPATLPAINSPAITDAIEIANPMPNPQPAALQKAEAKAAPKTRASGRVANQRAVDEADFLDLAGHELRAPMTILKGQAQLLQRRLRREGGREADLGELDKMLFQLERLNHQVGALLDTTHLNQRRMTLAPAEFDLASRLQRIVAMYAAGNPNVAIHYDAPAEPIVGMWDRLRIETVIRELLFNAIKFGGDEITVRLTREPAPTRGSGRHDSNHDSNHDSAGEQARIEVEDCGIGVPAGERRAIFGERARASNAAHAGVGLGLYVAREIVRCHHGRIGVRPRAPRGAPGSVFWVTLPITHPA
jgi:signal transduction histidine kinase